MGRTSDRKRTRRKTMEINNMDGPTIIKKLNELFRKKANLLVDQEGTPYFDLNEESWQDVLKSLEEEMKIESLSQPLPDRVKNDPFVQTALMHQMEWPQIVDRILKIKEDLFNKYMESSMLSPFKVKDGEGNEYMWRAPDDLVPFKEGFGIQDNH